ncbi:SufB/SufD family protein [Butyrivibrio sp. XPD2006]|uniref:SufB/SufD family protein n=1 Tax=Butyrivibrio sp. XPD2006 TaxID=1280668 RepID=UPI0003B43684|nr:SufD family Fe-S cluster assembly protein [Butyrivibrio sp. XPD2006]
MSNDLNMKVNVLPVLTYNFLHVNDSTLQISDFNISDNKSPLAKELPAGVTVRQAVPFAEAGELFKANNDRILATIDGHVEPNGDTSKRDDSQALRTGMGADVDGLMISMGATVDIYTVDEGVKADKPIVISYDMKDGDASLSGQIIHAKKDSEVTVVIVYTSDKDAKGFQGVSTRLFAEDGARINLIKSQLLGDGFVHFDDIGGACLNDGKIDLVTVELGGCKVFSSAYVNLAEKNTEFTSNMGYLVRGDHNLDINYVADQRGKKTQALMQFKGVLMDTASKTFRGTLDFKKGSSGSVGDEQEDTLLLGEDVVNKTMPVILCQEEDVEGRHGATIGELGEDILFYMQTRGIDEEEAKRIMIKARLDSVARLIPDPEIMQKTLYYIQNIV